MKKSLFSISAATLLALTSIPAQALDDNLVYVAVEPCRLADTRNTTILSRGVARDFQVSGADLSGQGGDAGGCLQPRTGTGIEPLAASVYLVAVPTSGTRDGWLTAFPSDQATPSSTSVATVNYAEGQVVGNTTNVTLCPGGCPGGGPLGLVSFNSAQHVVMDIQGYFYPAAGSCSDDMVAAGSVCVDKYEASVWSTATGGTQYGVGSDDYPCDNNGSDCGAAIYALSEATRTPSAYITQYQASMACANVGKRLATTAEWQMAAAGTPSGTGDGSTGCNSNTGNTVVVTGNAPSCVSTAGAFDMVGNVWEWGGEIGSDQIAQEFTNTDDMAGRAHGEAYNNSSSPLTPSTKSMFILDTRFGGSGINAQNPQIGLRCAR